ncbi:MAG: OpgC domain-containing protein, partial [Lachnospiraceae bacterium]|nr:OpgC domain-containing protein [Lachnospiraceae bacterium]
MNDTEKANQLQFLRFMAFMLIFMWHSLQHEVWWSPSINGAASAVSFFIILSGFVSAYSSYGAETDCSIAASLRYLWKKIVKFYPLYLATNLLAALYSGIPEMIRYQDIDRLKNMGVIFLRNVLMIQSWVPHDYFM